MNFLKNLPAVSAALMLHAMPASAQDSRQVKEPQTPAICSVLPAQLESGKAESTDARAPDTRRLQAAIDACQSGQAVRLISRNGKAAFLSGALQLRSGVSIVLDAGVTVYTSTNPKDFDRGNGACGTNDDKGKGCKPFITADRTQGSGIYGDGVIDGQGGERILGKEESWWQIARRAQKENNRQNVPRLLEVTQSDNFTLHRITLRNSPNFHVTLNQVNGFTAWGVRIDTPANARNTDGIDPISSRNITIANTYIRTGDDNVAIKAGNNGPTENITIRNSHFYSGHGMSIGSETNGGVSNVLVDNLSMDGTTSGLRIKSDVSRGGLVQNINYRNVCIRNVKAPIDFDTHYGKDARGSQIPQYRDIKLEHVQVLTPGRIILQGYDASHPMTVRLQDVVIDASSAIQREHLQLLGDAGAAAQSGFNAESANPKQCDQAFAAFPDNVVALKRPQLDATTAQQFSYAEVLKYAGMPGNEKADPWDPLSAPIAANPDLLPDYIVDASVKADDVHSFNRVQDAVSRAIADAEKKADKSKRIYILVKPGTYRELVYVPAVDSPITLYGTDAAKTKISANLDAAVTGSVYQSRFASQFNKTHASITAMYESLKDRPALGTFGTGVLWVKSKSFEAKNLTIENAYNKDVGNARADCPAGVCPDAGVYAQTKMVHHQALAVMLDGADKTHFDGVRMLGFQDTLYMRSGANGETARYFFNHAYVEGDVDFIFGDATAYFYQSEIKALGDRGNAYMAAPSTNINSRYGFVFDHCRFTHDGSVNSLAGKFYLARQWFHNERCTPYGVVPVPGYDCQLGQVDVYAAPNGTITKKTLESVGKMVVMNSVIGAHIHPLQPWSDWNKYGTLPYRPAQYSSDDYWANLKASKIDPVKQLGYPGPMTPMRVFLAELNNTDE